MKKFFIHSAIIILSLFIFSCSSDITHDDAVRIKKEHQNKYNRVKKTNKLRNGSALRGTVYSVETIIYSCNDSVTSKEKYVIFRDSSKNAPIEEIPLNHVDLVGLKENIELDTNWFENYNDPLNPRALREVPTSIVELDTCNPCNCESVELTCPFTECRKNKILDTWFFLEFKGGMALYNDNQPGGLGEVAREEYIGEIIAGVRLGPEHKWGLGVAFNTGVPLYNTLQDVDLFNPDMSNPTRRPIVMLHGKYSFDDVLCMFPFVYGQFGLAIDDLSLDLFNFTTSCDECKREYEAGNPGADVSIPLSYGFGAGVDIPLSCDFDLSFDVGYKNVAFGEQSPFTFGGYLVPEKRRVGMFLLKLGITI